ncbi:MAG: hypothetical protein AAF587_40870 [Bacteroidota bacterium]
MSKSNPSQFSKSTPNRFNSKEKPSFNLLDELPKPGQMDLFPIAVFIMGIVSCYTTAVGLQPMLNSLVLSYAMAIALSIFLVAIALRIPMAYKSGDQRKLILGYTLVALFSVLLNFNAIYGVFTSEKLLYEELKNNKSALTAMQVQARESLEQHFNASDIQRQLKEAEALLEEEKTNPNNRGYGEIARKLNKETVIPLQAQLANIQAKYVPTMHRIDSVVQHAQTGIDAALASGEIRQYRQAVDQSIDAHTYVAESTENIVGKEAFAYQPLVFQHRDVGNLNHSLWTIINLHTLSGSQTAAVLVSLLLAILIDFIVLFVLVLINRPEKEEDVETTEQNISLGAHTSFSHPSTPVAEEAQERHSSIYAIRKKRESTETRKSGEYQAPIVQSTSTYQPVDELDHFF